ASSTAGSNSGYLRQTANQGRAFVDITLRSSLPRSADWPVKRRDLRYQVRVGSSASSAEARATAGASAAASTGTRAGPRSGIEWGCGGAAAHLGTRCGLPRLDRRDHEVPAASDPLARDDDGRARGCVLDAGEEILRAAQDEVRSVGSDLVEDAGGEAIA